MRLQKSVGLYHIRKYIQLYNKQGSSRWDWNPRPQQSAWSLKFPVFSCWSNIMISSFRLFAVQQPHKCHHRSQVWLFWWRGMLLNVSKKNYIITDGSSLKLWTLANSICIYNHVVRLDLICCVKLLSKFAFKLNLIKLILSLRERIKI